MPSFSRRAVVALVAAAAFTVPAAPAFAQDSTIPEDGAGVSTTPPVPLESPEPAPTPSSEPEIADALPNTGSDPRLLFMAGLALSLLGAGLRMRTVDADDY